MKALFLTHRLPYAPNRGDRIRAYHMIRVLSGVADVSVVSLVHDEAEESHARDVTAIAQHVRTARVPRIANLARAACCLPTRRPLTLQLLQSRAMSAQLRREVRQRRPDVVIAYSSSMARYAMEPPLREIPFVFDIVDVDSQKWRDLSHSARLPWRAIYALEARRLAPFERAAARRARATLVVNAKEAHALRQLVAGVEIHVVENGIDVSSFAPPGSPAGDPYVVFCGVLSYAPNEDAALRLGERIWPLVRRHRSDARLFIVGAEPTPRIQRLAVRDASITVTGRVPDVRPFLWSAAASAVPLMVARGLQNKVLEALAAGLPTVVTPIVADGLPTAALAGCAVAESHEQFAEAILAWLRLSGTERRAIAGSAQMESLTWERQLREFPSIVATAAGFRSAPLQ